MLWSLIAIALAAEPTLVLPADQDPGDWRAAAALTGFRIGAAGGGRQVELRHEGGGWVLVARDGRGLERRAGIAAPGTARAREDAMWLGASLLASLPAPPGASPLSLALKVSQPAGSAAPPASSAVASAAGGPRPVGVAAPRSTGADAGSTRGEAAPPRSAARDGGAGGAAAKRPATGSASTAPAGSTAKGGSLAAARGASVGGEASAKASNAARSLGEAPPTVAPSPGAAPTGPSARSAATPLRKEVPPSLSIVPGEDRRGELAGASPTSGPPKSAASAPGAGETRPEKDDPAELPEGQGPAATAGVPADRPSTVMAATPGAREATAPRAEKAGPENDDTAALLGGSAASADERPGAEAPSTVLAAAPPAREADAPQRARRVKRDRAPGPASPPGGATMTAGPEAVEAGAPGPLSTRPKGIAAASPPATSTPSPSAKGLGLGAWAGVGGALELRSGLSGGAGGALEAGLHLSPSLWLGAAWRWIEPRTIPAIEGAAVEPTRDLSLGLFWSPERPVAPWLGAGLGSSARGYTQGARTVADLRVPVASVEAGLRVDLDPRWSIGLVARGAQDLDVTEVIYGSRAPQTLPGWAVDLRSALRATFP